jgi:hypothetical protein
MMTRKKTLINFREACELNENGKHCRYQLLFAVNRGAFAIIKLLSEHKPPGKLQFAQIAVGMVLFTTVMGFDIFVFGLKWHGLASETPCRPKTTSASATLRDFWLERTGGPARNRAVAVHALAAGRLAVLRAGSSFS